MLLIASGVKAAPLPPDKEVTNSSLQSRLNKAALILLSYFAASAEEGRRRR